MKEIKIIYLSKTNKQKKKRQQHIWFKTQHDLKLEEISHIKTETKEPIEASITYGRTTVLNYQKGIHEMFKEKVPIQDNITTVQYK